MNVVFNQSFKDQKIPVKQHRNDKLQYTLQKLKKQKRDKYIETCFQMIHPHRVVTELGVGSLSALELHECGFDTFKTVIPTLVAQHHETPFVSLHFCAAPGDAIDQTNRWCQLCEITTHSWISIGQGHFKPHILFDDSGIIVTEVESLELENKPVFFITGNCNHTLTESELIPVLFKQIFQSLDLLTEKGLFIFKITEFYQHETKALLWILFNVFDSVVITKPHVSPCCSSTKYVVCSWFQKSKYVTQFKHIGSANNQGPERLFLIKMPFEWSYWLTGKQNELRIIQEDWQQKALQLCKILINTAPILSELQLKTLLQICWKDVNIREFAQTFLKKIQI
jgi:hypothetical protein